MTTVLIADSDPNLLSSLREALESEGYEVRSAASHVEAAGILAEASISILLVDAALESDGQHSLLDEALESAEDVRSIVALGEPTARMATSYIDRGAAAVIDKPIDLTELRRVLGEVVGGQGAFRATLKGVSLIDLFQVFHLGRRSLVVHVGIQPPAQVVFELGEIVHAERGKQVGESVLAMIVEAQSGAMRTEDGAPAGPRSIDKPFQTLLLDTLRTRDETLRAPVVDTSDLAMWAGMEPDPILSWAEELSSDLSSGPALAPAPEPVLAGEPLLTPEPVLAPEPEPEPPSVPDALVSPVTPAPLTRPRDAACRAVVAEIGGCLAAAIISLGDGALLGMHHQSNFTTEFDEFIASFTYRMLRGPEVQAIESQIAGSRGVDSLATPSIQELSFSTGFTQHLVRVMGGGTLALVVVTFSRVPLGETWPAVRRAAETLSGTT